MERPFAYLGMLGSPTKLNALVRELEKRGAPAGPLSAVRTPMGLSIGAETPAEIAVSIAAEITQIRRTNGPESSEI